MYNIGVKKIHRLIEHRNCREDATELVQLECREKRHHLQKWNVAHQIRPLVNSNVERCTASILENQGDKRWKN